MSTILSASPGPMTLAPIANIFASLCSLVACAEKQSWQSAALIPFILFAEIDIPIPVPQMMIPLSHSPEATAFAAACPYTG